MLLDCRVELSVKKAVGISHVGEVSSLVLQSSGQSPHSRHTAAVTLLLAAAVAS